mgnify:CR=1 FL=1
MKNIAKVAALTLALTSTAHTTHAETVTKNELPSLTAGISNELNSIAKSNDKIEYKTMYVTGTNVNIRKQPSTESKVIGHVHYNKKILVSKSHDNDWYVVLYKDSIGYINKKYVSNKKCDYKIFDVPYAKNKTWMPYAIKKKIDGKYQIISIFAKSSKQYKLQQIAYTGKYGIRMIDDRYCVALGSHFGCEIGQYFDLVLANGAVIPCIMADQKANKHTDSANIITVDTNCLSEFIVDRHSLKYEAKRDGDISSCCDEWNSPVVQIKVYKKVVKV